VEHPIVIDVEKDADGKKTTVEELAELMVGRRVLLRVEKGEAEVRRYGGVLNGCLSGRQFLCGNRLSLADFAVGSWLNYAQPAAYPIDDFREIRRWYAGLIELPAWRESIVSVA